MAYILQDEIAKAPLPTPEHMLGKGSMMPFNGSNSGGRKLMFGVNLEQRLPLLDPDVPFVSTGFEYQFGIHSSSYVTADDDYTVVAVIPKYTNIPHIHRFYVMISENSRIIKYVESCSYKHFTENYGFLYNHSALDGYVPGSCIEKGKVILKSGAFDEYDNRMDGKNMLVLYNSSEQTMEDGIIISESAAKKLASPLIHKIKIVINDNDIPLNLYGTRDNYKIFPDIGEMSKDSIVMGYRREKKEESLFTQSIDRLMSLSLSDEKITCSGRIIDINVYSNDPSKLEGTYFNQIKYYWDQQILFARSLVETVEPFIQDGYALDYEMQKLYYKSKGMLEGKQFFNERVFSNLNLEITVIEEIPILTGDKITNRYGGKGVVSEIRPDYLMPKTYNGDTFDVLANMCGVYGRENGGQLFELTVTAVGRALIDFWSEESLNTGECFKMYLDYLRIISPTSYEETARIFADKSDDVISEFIGSMITDGAMNVAINPMSENMTIDKVAELYKTFPWIEQHHILVPLPDSNGKIQYVSSHRPVVTGYVYYYRLKQYAKEKFSVTSLSATNIRNENSRNKASKNYKALYSRTPIRFGDMEIGDLMHLGADIVVQMLMLYATSPLARESYEKLMTGDPFNIDIKLDDTSSNRSAEIVETCLKTIGKKIVFRKVAKEQEHPVVNSPVYYEDEGLWQPITFYREDLAPAMFAQFDKEHEGKKELIHPISIKPICYEKTHDEVIKYINENEHMRLNELLKAIDEGAVDFVK